jgi:hypothetical protein
LTGELTKLHQLVCKQKTLTLKEAQQAIATDWVPAYKQYAGERKPFEPHKVCNL